jgi:hypothetical protein
VLLWFMGLAWRSAVRGYPVVTALAVGQTLAWLFALVAGLSSTFELAQGLLYFPTLAVLSKISLPRVLAPRRLPAIWYSGAKIDGPVGLLRTDSRGRYGAR